MKNYQMNNDSWGLLWERLRFSHKIGGQWLFRYSLLLPAGRVRLAAFEGFD